MSQNTGLVQLARFYNPTQAHIIRAKLEAEGIECVIFDEQHNSVEWYLRIALGGSRLMVLHDDYERAKDIFKTEMKLYAEQDQNPKPLIRKPFLKTILGTIVGFIAGAPSIPPTKKDEE